MNFQVFVPVVSPLCSTVNHICRSSCAGSTQLAAPRTALQKPAVSRVPGGAAAHISPPAVAPRGGRGKFLRDQVSSIISFM